VNGELVRLGYAEAVAYPPDTRYKWQLSQSEKEAKAAKLGIWGE
jgi:endonuclease YncB( thermonuclease family)